MMSSSRRNFVTEVSRIDNHIRYDEGLSLLHRAAITCSLDVVEDLLKKGANPNIQDVYGRTPLQFAVERNSVNIVVALLNHHASPNIQNKSGDTLLHCAAKKEDCNLAIVSELLKKNANVMIENYSGMTSLHYATISGNLSIISTLLESGKADPNIQDKFNLWTPLHHATMEFNLEAVLLLLNNNANVNIQDRNGRTPFFYAIIGGYPEIFSAFLRHEVDVNIRDNEGGETLLHCAVKSQTDGFVQALLTTKNADVNASDFQGQTPLHYAVQFQWLEAVKTLLENYADVNIQDIKGQSPLHYAVREESEDVIEALVMKNVNVNVQNYQGQTPIHFAVKEGNMNVIRNLLSSNADVNIRDNKGHNALHWSRNHHINFLILHVIQLNVAKIHVRKKNLDSVYNNFSDEWDSERIKIFKSNCKKEVAKMNCEKIGDSAISFSKFMEVNLHTRANYLNYKSLIQALRLAILSKKFPLYHYILKNLFAEAFNRNELLRQVRCYGGSNSIFQRLPAVCIDQIYSYLSDDDLKILIPVLELASKSD